MQIDPDNAPNLVKMLVGGDDVGELVGVHNGRMHHIPCLHPLGGVAGEKGNGRFDFKIGVLAYGE